MSKAKVGYSVGVITPRLGVGLSGYNSEGRVATGIHDELHTRVLLLEKDAQFFLIVQNELLAVDYAFSDRVKDIAAKYGISNRDNVFVGTTHTHSGPKSILQSVEGLDADSAQGVLGKYDSEMCEKMFSVIENCISKAKKNLSPCSMNYNFAQVEGVGENRNHKSLPCDKTLLAMEFIREDGKKLLLYHYSCHPTVLNAKNTLYTADWPYGVTKSAEGSVYDMTMFINGSAGDISTRFTRSAPTFEEAERIGELLYDYINKALDNPVHEEIDAVGSLSFTFQMALKPFESVEVEEQRLEKYLKELQEAKSRGETALRLYESKVEGAVFSLQRAKAFSDEKEMELTLQILKLNDFVFVFLPNELFCALSLPIREEFGEKVLFCSYFTSCQGYICDTVAYDNETYEAMTSPFERGEGEKLMEKTKEFLV